MKTKRKITHIKTIKNKKQKGGHKISYDYDVNIKEGTNKPLTGKYVHEKNCVSCVLYSLGFMSKDTARYLQRIDPAGVKTEILLDMINNTYGPGHMFINYKTADSLKSYLLAGEATLGVYGALHDDGITPW